MSIIHYTPHTSPPPTRKTKKTNKMEKKSLKIVICRSLRSNTKQAEFQALIQSEDADIILASETHLDNTFPSHIGLPDGYNAFRTENYLGSGGGGTLLAFKESILLSPIESNSQVGTWGKLITCGERPVFIGSLYRNPSSTIQQLEELESSPSNITTGQSLPLIILGGNVNLPDIDWETSAAKPSTQYAGFGMAWFGMAWQ